MDTRLPLLSRKISLLTNVDCSSVNGSGYLLGYNKSTHLPRITPDIVLSSDSLTDNLCDITSRDLSRDNQIYQKVSKIPDLEPTYNKGRPTMFNLIDAGTNQMDSSLDIKSYLSPVSGFSKKTSQA